MKNLLSGITLAAVVWLPSIAQATIMTTASGLATFDQLIDFSTPSLAPDTVVTNQYTPLGITFAATGAGAVRANSCGVGVFDGEAGMSADTLNTYGPGCVTNGVDDSFSMMFNNDVSAASFSLRSYRDGLTNVFTALLNGVVVDTFVHDASTDVNLSDYIFDSHLTFSNIVFDEIRFTESSFSQDGYLIFDNVAFVNAVPEPASLSLLGLGLLGFAAARRKSADNT